MRRIKRRMAGIHQDIKRLLSSITPINAKYVDGEIVALEREREALERRLAQAKSASATAADIEAQAAEIVGHMRYFESVLEEGRRRSRV